MATFNVLDFGATANDASDDSAAIQAAIDAAYDAGGGTVYIPEGTFIISGDKTNPSAGCIEVRSNVTLTGDGAGETILKLADHFDTRINGLVRTPVDESASNVTIMNLTIDGNRANNIEHQAGIITGVKENEDGKVHENITISGVEVKNCTAYGINPHEVTYNLTIADCVSHDNGKDGFVADYVVGGVYSNNIAYNNDRHGFNIQNSSSDILLENNTAYDNGLGATGGAGIVVQRSDIFPDGENTIPWVTDVHIVGGNYYGNSREGILIKLSDGVEVTGALVHDNMRQGIRIEGATNTVIHDNEIYDNSQESPGTYDEINIRIRLDDVVTPPRTYYSENTKVFDNSIHSDGTSRYGIREELSNSTADNPSGTVVHDNDISGTLSGDVFVPPYSATEGDDYFYGTSSGDSFAGLGGNDTYVVNHSGDVVTEQVNAGIDTIIASLNYTLSANVENLLLTGTAVRGTGNDLANLITGNDIANELEGLGGDDTLDGGLGADTMQGGDGNDIYYVDNVLDVIIEKDHAGLGGIDTVYSTVSYTLAVEVEKLVLQGTDNLNATGNSLANELTGNDGNNILDGMAGADTMRGGAGDDTYIVDHSGDVVIELQNQGFDTVKSVLTYTLGDHLEKLVLTGNAQRDGTGNALDNVLVGNDGNNKLHGMDGDDTIEGGLGADQLYGDGGNDLFILRKGEFAGDIIEDFTGNGAALGDRIQFTGFTTNAVLVNVEGDVWQVQDGAYTETFRVKIPLGAQALHATDYTIDGIAPPANTAPSASATGNGATGQEDTVLTGSVPGGIDAEGGLLTYSLVAPVPGLSFNSNGSYSFTPAANFYGDVSFQYLVHDVEGATSAAQSFAITITPVNDIPVAATVGNSVLGNEDTIITGAVPSGSDVEAGALTYALVAPVTGLALNANGTFSYTPAANFHGSVGFQYVVKDAQGGISAAQGFAITVNSVNDAPVTSTIGNSKVGIENTVITGALPVASDADGDTLAYSLVSPVTGLVLNPNGTFSYTPAANFHGSVGFQYVAKDPSGASSAAQAFAITVNSVNEAPVASTIGNSKIGMENTVITGALPVASDADGDTLSYSLVSPVTGLVLNPNGTFSYTPAANFHGSVGFQYVAKDPSGASSAAQAFAITVNSSNKAPASLDLTGNKTVSENVAIGTVVGGLLATDPDGDTLTYTLTDNAGGLFKIDGNAIVTAQAIDYETLASKNGTITVEARDPENLAITKSFTIAVADVNEPASNLSLSKASVKEDVAVGTTVGTFMAVDPENGELSYLLTDSAGGLFKLDGTTLVTAKALDYDKVQSDTVTVEVTDSGGLKTSQVFTISISDVMETTVGSNASQAIKGGAGSDKIDGKGGNDTLYGLGGNDLLYGGAGNDKLYGGLGSDKLFGGTGNDTFVFNTKLGSDNVDTIDDFSVAQDVIWLDDDVFAKVGKVGDLSGAAFYAGKVSHDATDRIIYDKSTGKLFYDADGNGKGQAIQFALLDKGLALTAHHFDIIA